MKNLILIMSIFYITFFACSKKDRLQSDTLVLHVIPSKVIIEPTKSIELQVIGESAKSNNVDINPEWFLIPETLGTISPKRGKKVTFTASAYTQTGKIKVVEETVYTEVNVTITTQTQPGGYSLVLNVYNDEGISGDDVWTWSENNVGSFDADHIDQTAPEGSKTFKTETNAGSWAGWGVVYNTPRDLSQYQGGSLKFWVKSPARLKIEIKDGNDKVATRYTDQYGYQNNNEWSELTIPLSDFTGISWNKIKLPFMVTIETQGTFYIDYVRWVK